MNNPINIETINNLTIFPIIFNTDTILKDSLFNTAVVFYKIFMLLNNIIETASFIMPSPNSIDYNIGSDDSLTTLNTETVSVDDNIADNIKSSPKVNRLFIVYLLNNTNRQEITANDISVPNIPNAVIQLKFLKKLLLLIFYPAAKIIGGNNYKKNKL